MKKKKDIIKEDQEIIHKNKIWAWKRYSQSSKTFSDHLLFVSLCLIIIGKLNLFLIGYLIVNMLQYFYITYNMEKVGLTGIMRPKSIRISIILWYIKISLFLISVILLI